MISPRLEPPIPKIGNYFSGEKEGFSARSSVYTSYVRAERGEKKRNRILESDLPNLPGTGSRNVKREPYREQTGVEKKKRRKGEQRRAKRGEEKIIAATVGYNRDEENCFRSRAEKFRDRNKGKKNEENATQLQSWRSLIEFLWHIIGRTRNALHALTVLFGATN